MVTYSLVTVTLVSEVRRNVLEGKLLMIIYVDVFRGFLTFPTASEPADRLCATLEMSRFFRNRDNSDSPPSARYRLTLPHVRPVSPK